MAMKRGSKWYYQRPRHFNQGEKTEKDCLRCGKTFVSNRDLCPQCLRFAYTHGNDFAGNNQSLIYMDLEGVYGLMDTEHVRKAKEMADHSGNPRIYTGAECSQEFLKSLIPTR